MLFFVRFIIAFILTLAIAAVLIYIFKPSFAMMNSPSTERAILTSIYKQQNDGAVQRNAGQAMTNVASDCLFFDSHDVPMPVPPIQQKLKDLYAGIGRVKATSELKSVKFDGNNADVLAENKVDWVAKGGRKIELRTMTRDNWQKLVGHWTCLKVKIESTSDSHLGFAVPH